MNPRSIPCLVALACWTAPLTADVLDDAGVKLTDLLARRPTDPFFQRGDRPELLAGIPLSLEHEAAIVAAELPDRPSPERNALRAGLLESRGEFAKALEIARAEHRMLDQARLLLRAGRAEEAAAALAGMANAKPSGRQIFENARGQVMAACRPLEDSEQWNLLESYLGILAKNLPAPRWQGAVWLEQLDIAYHRGRLPEMKAAAGEDKLRLGLYHRQIGELDQSEKLVAELASDPSRVGELLAIFPQSNTLRGIAFARWQSKDLAPEERRQLWERLNELPSTAGFSAVFLSWLASGEDATPIQDTVAKTWALISPASDSPERLELLEAMLRRFPEDHRFRLLVARQIMESDRARATELFAAMASAPLRAGWRPWLPEVYPVDMRTVREQISEDPALFGFAGLASLNRQDKAKAILDSNKSWPELPAVDRARYLAAANLDHELVALAMSADYTLPDNDGLAQWLAAVFRERGRERVIPAALYPKIAAQLSELVLGSPEKEEAAIGSDAQAFVSLLGESPMELPDLRAAVRRMTEAAAARRAELKTSLEQDVASGASNVPRLKGIFAYPAGKEPLKLGGPSAKIEELNAYLTLLTPPRIQRIPSAPGQAFSRGNRFPGGFAPNPRFAPPQALLRWSDSLPLTGNRWSEKPTLLTDMMKNFPAGHPRRIMAELFIATNAIPCPDEALKKECTATLDDVVDGKLKLPGTELFRYLSLSARKAGDEALMAVLEEVKKQPPGVQAEFLANVYLDSRGTAQALARKVLSKEDQRARPERQDRDPDYLKLRELSQNGLGASPEALRLARVVLDRAVDRHIEASRSADENKRQQLSYALGDLSTPLRTLEQAALLDGWIEEAARKMRGSGMQEVGVLRALQQLDRNRTRREGDPGSPYARKIFDLDPRDQESAAVVLTAALADRDRELVLRCMHALGLSAFSRGSGERPVLALFAGGGEGLLLDVIEGSSITRAYLDNRTAERLHAFFLAGDKTLAKRFRAWVSRNRMEQSEYRAAFARQLLAAGDTEGAVELYASVFVVAGDFDGAPWVFPPKPGIARNSRISNVQVSRMAADVQFMSERGLTAQVLALMEKSGQPEGIESATLRLAAKPDRETFDKFALPLLERLEPNSRGRVLAEWVDLFAAMPAATGLHVRILEEQIGMSGAAAYQLGPAIREAARLPGGSALLAKAWKRLAEDIRIKDPNFGDGADQVGREIFSAMIELSDKATWDEYWKWRQADGQPLLQSFNWREWSSMDGDLAPERLRVVLPRILREAKGAENVQGTPVWLGTAIETGDPELIRMAKEALPESAAKFATLCDLALGDPEGLAPYVGAYSGDDGSLTVWWNLVSLRDPQGQRTAEIPVAAFPKLDGKFELQVLGGPAPDKLSTLETVRAAPVCGSVRLKLDKDVPHVGLLVTQPGGGVVRMSPTVGRKPSSSGGGEPVDLRGEVLGAKGFTKMARSGPGGLPAWKIRAGGNSRVDLAEIPWDGGGQIRLRGWVTGSDDLGLVCYDAKGAVLNTIHLGSSESFVPVWRLIELDLPKGEQVPASTVRMVLAVVGDSSQGARSFAVAGLKLSTGGATNLPDGFRKIGRVPGQGSSMAMDADGKRFAIGLTDGRVALMDVASGAFELIPTVLDGMADDNEQSGISDIVWAAGSIYAADRSGSVYRIDPAAKKSTALPVTGSRGSPSPANTLCASRDSKWVAWLKNATTLVIMPSQGGPLREIEVKRCYNMNAGEDGLRLTGQNSDRYLLKNEDMAAGQPVEADINRENWDPDPRRTPLWRNLEFASHKPAERKSYGNDGIRTSIPTENCYLIAPDNTLYYTDRYGVVVEVKPSGKGEPADPDEE